MTGLSRHPRSAPGPVARASAVRWGRSVLDWQCHAVDQLAEHPRGTYRAQCGHHLMVVTLLHAAPAGRVCQECVAGARPLDHLWRALPGEPLCADAGDPVVDRRCVLVDGHGGDIDHTARDGASWPVGGAS